MGVESALFTLDQRRPLSGRARVLIAVCLVLYAVVTASMVTVATTPLQAVTWVPLCRSLLFAVITGISAVLLYGQARTTQQRGYVWLAGGYLYVALMNLVAPLFEVGAFRPGEALIGSAQSASYLLYLWVWYVPIGLVYSAWLLRPSVFDSDRRPHLRGGLVPRVLTVCALAVVSLVVILWAVPYLPLMVSADGKYTYLNTATSLVWLVYAVVATLVLIVLAMRYQTVIHRWMSAMLLIILGHAVVGALTQPWSLGSYYNAALTVVSSSLLLIVLLSTITQINQATNIAATQDELTNSASRLSLTRGIDEEIGRHRVCALLWISIDGFEAVTAAIGPQQGDELLRVLADRFESVAGNVGRVGRLGNSEFGIVVSSAVDVPPDSQQPIVTDFAKAALQATRKSITLSGVTTWVSCSVGIASTQQQASTTTELLQYADLAMRAARNSGGDRFRWFNEEIGEADIGQAMLRQKLNRSIRNEEFDIDYQPIIVTGTGQLVGFEALVRWLHDGRRISASEFISLAERTGQVVSIGRLVVRKLQSQVDQLLELLPPDGFVTFNLSAPELADDVIIDFLCNDSFVHQSGSLIVEITESIEMEPRSKARLNLRVLQQVGYRIAIDDFGSGFSNFTFLEEIRPELLKIDRTIVVRAGAGAKGGLAFLSAAVQVARSLDCAVLAEGIELADEESVVATLDIDYMQGFRFGRPAPLDSFTQEKQSGSELPSASLPVPRTEFGVVHQ